jgi:hypothetical protein
MSERYLYRQTQDRRSESALVDTIAHAIANPGEYVESEDTDGLAHIWSRWQARAVIAALDEAGWPEVL